MSDPKLSQKIQDKPGGNTKTPGQLYLYMITLPFDKNEDPSELSQNLKTFCKKFTFQKEQGDKTGYVHWQIFISLKTKEYFTAVKNLFPSGAHIEGCKDGWAAAKYCEKSETRLEGPYTEKSVFLKIITKLYPWQQKIRDECLTDPDDRKIIWVWEAKGGIGKTQFCKYMAVKHGATILGNGAFKDIAQALPTNPKIVMFNITRDLEERFNYSAIEAVKDGLMFSGKYESHTKIFNSPHVVVFSNFEPRKSAMSADRWNVIHLDQS